MNLYTTLYKVNFKNYKAQMFRQNQKKDAYYNSRSTTTTTTTTNWSSSYKQLTDPAMKANIGMANNQKTPQSQSIFFFWMAVLFILVKSPTFH